MDLITVILLLNFITPVLMMEFAEIVSYKKTYMWLLATTYFLPVLSYSIIHNFLNLLLLSLIIYSVHVLIIVVTEGKKEKVLLAFFMSYLLLIIVKKIGFI